MHKHLKLESISHFYLKILMMVSPGKAGETNRTDMAWIRSGCRGAKSFRIARQARPIVFRPCEIGLSNPASRAITGSAWTGM